MGFRTRLISALLICVLLAGLIGVAIYGSGNAGSSNESLFSSKTTLNLWYSDDALTDWLNDVAVSYNESQNAYRVEPKLIEDTDYIKMINDQSVAGVDFPDLYIAGNNQLERLYKGGLAAIIHDDAHFRDTPMFPQTAVNAVTYEDNLVAYPLSFETSAFLYNEDLLETMIEAISAGSAEDADSEDADSPAAEDDAAAEAVDSDDPDSSAADGDSGAGEAEEETGKVPAGNANESTEDLSEQVPQTMVDIINLSNKYNAPEDLTAIFKWDVSDIFYNYCFVGNYMDVGGPAGDDPNELDIYNDKVIQCLQVYQQLNQYFSIDTHADDYDTVLQDFIDGKIIFTIATSDAVAKIAEAVNSGESTIRYGVANIPDSTSELLNKTMSMTDCVVINAYGEHQDAANAFAQYMLFRNTGDFYESTGKALAQAGYVYSDPHMDGFYQAYVDSVPMTKLREAANFWMLLENCFATVWDGADANTALHDMTQQLMIQISGTQNYQVQKLPDPPEISIRSELEEED